MKMWATVPTGCHSVLELQLPLDDLEATLLAQGIQERVGLQILQARIPQPQSRLEPLERLGSIAPLRIDRGVLIGWGVAEGCRQFRKDSFRIGVPAELVIDHREAPLAHPVVRLPLPQGAPAL